MAFKQKFIQPVLIQRMLKSGLILAALIPLLSHANSWVNYQGVTSRNSLQSNTRSQPPAMVLGNADRLSKPVPLQQFPPAHQRHLPQQQPYPYPTYPQAPQNGLTIIYHQSLPTTVRYQSNQTGYVNGSQGRIESSQYMLIADWRRYGLPDPQVGMHWIYQNGRYMQVPNDRK